MSQSLTLDLMISAGRPKIAALVIKKALLFVGSSLELLLDDVSVKGTNIVV